MRPSIVVARLFPKNDAFMDGESQRTDMWSRVVGIQRSREPNEHALRFVARAILHSREARTSLRSTGATQRRMQKELQRRGNDAEAAFGIPVAIQADEDIQQLYGGERLVRRMIMDSVSLASVIQQTCFAADLAQPFVQQLAAISKKVSFSKGQILFREGEQHHNFYLICAGHVSLEMCLPARGCTRLLTVGPGELLAWSSLVGDDARMSATAIAQDDVQLIAIPGKELLAACEANHELGFQIMKRLATGLSRRLFATRLQMLDMFMSDAPPKEGRRQ